MSVMLAQFHQQQCSAKNNRCSVERYVHLTKSAARALADSNSGLRSIASSNDARTLSALETQVAGMLFPSSLESPGLRLVSGTNHGATARHIALGHADSICAPSWSPMLTRGERNTSFAACRKDATLKGINIGGGKHVKPCHEPGGARP